MGDPVAKRSRVQLDHKNIGRVLTSDRMYAGLEKVAAAILAEVKDAAPVDTGAYKESLHLARDLTDRAVVRVVSDSPYGLAVEARDAPMAVGLNRSKQ